MYIPKTIKVKVQENKGSTGPFLGYATFIDERGALRKEKSWNSWGNKIHGEFDNVPLKGFKLEKTVQRSRDWFGSGRSVFRIIHPNFFIFEISANNLSEIILSSNINCGEIVDECILAWDKTNLALIPCSTEDYNAHKKATELIENGPEKISELIVGNFYQNRDGGNVGHYVGKFPTLKVKKLYVNKNGKSTTSIRWGYGNDVLRVDMMCTINECHFFKTGYGFQTYVSPTVYKSLDKKPIVVEPDFVPEVQYYYDQIIPSDIARRKDPDELKAWILKNENILKSQFQEDQPVFIKFSKLKGKE